jgi:hypothetical protein
MPLASFHTASPSLALCPRCQPPPETRARVPDRPGHRRPRQASPSSAPRWDTCPRAQFSLLHSVLANFGFADAQPRRTTVLARWPTDLAWSSSPALVPKVLLPLLKLSNALACLKPPPRGRNASPELLQPTRDPLSAVLPSLPSDSWPLPRHWVRRGVLSLSAQLRRPRSHPSSRLPQLRRPHRREEEQRCLQPFIPPRSDPLRPIFIAWPRSRDTASRSRAWRPGLPVSAQASWRWARSVSAPSPSAADTSGPLVNARPPARAPSAADVISAVGFRSDG